MYCYMRWEFDPVRFYDVHSRNSQENQIQMGVIINTILRGKKNAVAVIDVV